VSRSLALIAASARLLRGSLGYVLKRVKCSRLLVACSSQRLVLARIALLSVIRKRKSRGSEAFTERLLAEVSASQERKRPGG
jgi:hypothetical protein